MGLAVMVANLVPPQTVNAKIRAWKYARLSTDGECQGFPKTNVLHPTHGVGTARSMSVSEADAVEIQGIVEKMLPEIRSAFEAYYLGLIRGDTARAWGHKARWLLLGIGKTTYFARKNAGWEFVQRRLSD